jgi:hypothetical protein
MTSETKEQPGLFRRGGEFLWTLLQNLDHSYLDYSVDQTRYAMERIRVLEAEIAELKARLPT